MKLIPIKANMTELIIDDKHVLFSYKTPVAYGKIKGGIGNGMVFFKTNKYYSKTTTKHINQWLQRYGHLNDAQTVDQSELDDLVK